MIVTSFSETSNLSLDELMEQMDTHKFFRANRQFIVSIKSVKGGKIPDK